MASTYVSRCRQGRNSRMTNPIAGVRPRPPPTSTRNPTSPFSSLSACKPMSCTATAARSDLAPFTANLNLRGRYENSGWNVDHCRMISHQTKESTISSCATPAKWSVVILRKELPEVWIACICTVASSARMSGACGSFGHFSTRQNLQLNWPKLPQAPDILAELATVQMHAIQTSGNSFRNITTDHFAGVAQDEIVDSFVW